MMSGHASAHHTLQRQASTEEEAGRYQERAVACTAARNARHRESHLPRGPVDAGPRRVGAPVHRRSASAREMSKRVVFKACCILPLRSQIPAKLAVCVCMCVSRVRARQWATLKEDESDTVCERDCERVCTSSLLSALVISFLDWLPHLRPGLDHITTGLSFGFRSLLEVVEHPLHTAPVQHHLHRIASVARRTSVPIYAEGIHLLLLAPAIA